MWLLWLISQGIAGVLSIAVALGRGTERARSADTGGGGPACFHGRITTARSRLSGIRNAIVVCPSGGRCHHEKRKCEQRRGGGGELFQSHPVFSCFSRSHKRFLSARSALSFTTRI